MSPPFHDTSVQGVWRFLHSFHDASTLVLSFHIVPKSVAFCSEANHDRVRVMCSVARRLSNSREERRINGRRSFVFSRRGWKSEGAPLKCRTKIRSCGLQSSKGFFLICNVSFLHEFRLGVTCDIGVVHVSVVHKHRAADRGRLKSFLVEQRISTCIFDSPRGFLPPTWRPGRPLFRPSQHSAATSKQ